MNWDPTNPASYGNRPVCCSWRQKSLSLSPRHSLSSPWRWNKSNIYPGTGNFSKLNLFFCIVLVCEWHQDAALSCFILVRKNPINRAKYKIRKKSQNWNLPLPSPSSFLWWPRSYFFLYWRALNLVSSPRWHQQSGRVQFQILRPRKICVQFVI